MSSTSLVLSPGISSMPASGAAASRAVMASRFPKAAVDLDLRDGTDAEAEPNGAPMGEIAREAGGWIGNPTLQIKPGFEQDVTRWHRLRVFSHERPRLRPRAGSRSGRDHRGAPCNNRLLHVRLLPDRGSEQLAAIDQQRHRAVVHQGHGHVGLESPGRDRHAARVEGLDRRPS